MGRDRWAWGPELSCGAGGCRNLAVWLVREKPTQPRWPRVASATNLYDDRHGTAGRPWLSCNLHLASRRKLFTARQLRPGTTLEVLPLEDPTQRPLKKRKRQPVPA